MFPSLDLQYSFDKVFYRTPVHMYLNFLLTAHDQDLTSFLILQTASGSYISWYSHFIFYYTNTLEISWALVHITLSVGEAR